MIFNLGGHGPKSAISSILKFNIDEGKWYNTSYHVRRPRYFFGISVVDFKEYSKACVEPKL